MSVVVGVLVALAVVTAAGPAPRRVPRDAARERWPQLRSRAAGSGPGRGRGGAGGTGASRDGSGGATAARRRRPARPRPVAEGTDLPGLLHAVAAQVRAGVPPPAAWSAVLREAVDGQVPDADLLTAVVGARGAPPARVRAVVAGARVAAETGAPLADVLEDLADAVTADAEQAGELEAALAGPRATARVLVVLPLLGLLVGAAMGARPWQVLADGGLGSALGAAGVVLVVVGRSWVGGLLRRAGAP